MLWKTRKEILLSGLLIRSLRTERRSESRRVGLFSYVVNRETDAVCVCVCACVCARMCVCVLQRVSVCVWVSECMCMNFCVCMTESECVWVRKCMCLSLCVYDREWVWVCVWVRECMCMSSCACVWVWVWVWVYVLSEHLKFRNLFPVLKWAMDDKFDRIWKEMFVNKSR
jgi:hypothetical protein